MRKKKTIDSMVSTSLVNLAYSTVSPPKEDCDFYVWLSEIDTQIYRALFRCVECGQEFASRNVHNVVKAHKQAFGSQDYCFTGKYRYWVWHDPDDRYRVFVSNRGGLRFEVNETTVKTFEEGLALREEYVKKLFETTSGFKKALRSIFTFGIKKLSIMPNANFSFMGAK